jgi:transposase
MTCWRRLAEWHEAGVWLRMHELLLAELNAADMLDWSKAVIDGSHLRVMKGGPKPHRAQSIAPRPARNTM